MILNQQNVVFDFGSVDQKRGKNHLSIGRLINAENVQQDKTKVFKRRFAEASVGLASAPADARDLINADWGMVARSSVDIRFANIDTENAWHTAGASTMVGLARVTPAMADVGQHPTHAILGERLFTFAKLSNILPYKCRILDVNTDAELVPEFSASPGINAVGSGKAVAAGGAVFLFYMSATLSRLEVTKVTTAGAITQFTVQLNAGDSYQNFDVTLAPNGYPLVAVWGTTKGIANSISCYYLDHATNAVKAAPGSVNTALASAPGELGAWLSDKSGNYTKSYLGIVLTTATAMTVRAFDNTTLVGSTPAGTDVTVASKDSGSLAGYVLDNGTPNLILFYTAGTAASVDLLKIQRYDFVASFGVISDYIRSGAPMGEPFRPLGASAKWYLATVTADATNTQNAVYIYDVSASSPQIVARALYHSGGPRFNGRGVLELHDWKNQGVTWDPASAIVHICSGGSIGALASVGNFGTYRLRFDFAADIGPMCTELGGKHVIVPGAWPQRIGPDGRLIDIAPAMFPYGTAGVNSGGGVLPAGIYTAVAIYESLSGTDTIMSAPSPAVVVTAALNDKITYTIPTLRKLNNTTNTFIKLYVSKANGSSLFLVSIIVNDPTVDAITKIVGNEPTASEEPYTTGGVAERGSPPACYSCFSWRNRTFLCGTEIPDEVWVSSNDPDVIGFDDLTAFRVLGGIGRVYAGAQVDYNSAVLWKGDSAHVINGAGPSLVGAGTYEPVQLTGRPGCNNPRSVVTGDQGAYFEGADDGAPWLMTPSLAAVYVGQGVKDLDGVAIAAVVHVPASKHIRFYLASGLSALVWDYGNPLPEEGSLGQWYTWTNLPALIKGACVRGGVAYMIGSDGVLRKEDTANITTTGLPLLKFPIVFAGIAGFACVYEGVLIGEFLSGGFSAPTIEITYETNGGTAQGGTSQTFTLALLATPAACRFLPSNMDAATAIVTIRDTSAAGTYQFEGIGFVVGIQPGLRRLNTSQNM